MGSRDPLSAPRMTRARARSKTIVHMVSDLRLIVDVLSEDDAACLAETCKAFGAVVSSSPTARWPLGTRTSAKAAAVSLARLEWARSRGCPLPPSTCAAAARAGRLDVLRELRRLGCPWLNGAQGVCAQAALGGHIDTLRWSRANGCPWDNWTCYAAAEADANRLEILDWAVANGAPLSPNVYSVTVREGRVDLTMWLYEHHVPWNEELGNTAAEKGHLNILAWAWSRGLPLPTDLMWSAANGGHFPVIKWVLDHGFKWETQFTTPEDVFSQMAFHGVELLEWAHERGCRFDGKALVSAACCGDNLDKAMPMLRWLKEHGCPWTAWACRVAAAHGAIEILKWLHSNGCPWDEGTCRAARRYTSDGHETLRWAQAHGCPDDGQLGEEGSEVDEEGSEVEEEEDS